MIQTLVFPKEKNKILITDNSKKKKKKEKIMVSEYIFLYNFVKLTVESVTVFLQLFTFISCICWLKLASREKSFWKLAHEAWAFLE